MIFKKVYNLPKLCNVNLYDVTDSKYLYETKAKLSSFRLIQNNQNFVIKSSSFFLHALLNQRTLSFRNFDVDSKCSFFLVRTSKSVYFLFFVLYKKKEKEKEKKRNEYSIPKKKGKTLTYLNLGQKRHLNTISTRV